MGTGGQNCPLILWFNLGFIEVLHSSTAKTMETGLQNNAHYKEIHIILVTRQKMKQTLAKNKSVLQENSSNHVRSQKKDGAKILRGAEIKL